MWFFDLFRWQGLDVIRWENPSPDLLIKKWDHNLDEIKNNSSLIIEPGYAAILIHNGLIEGIQQDSGKWSLESENIPFISSLKNFMSGFESHDKMSIYFIKNKEVANQKWGTPNETTYIDPVYNFPVEIKSIGNYTFRVNDIEKFWVNYVAWREEVSTNDIRMMINDRIIGLIGTLFAKKKLSYNHVDAYLIDIANELLEIVKPDFAKLGLELTDFRIEDIAFSNKTNEFIDKVTAKASDVASMNTLNNVDANAKANYMDLEKLNIMWKAAENEGTAGDMMWAGVGMAMGMWMAQNMNAEKSPSYEDKLVKLKEMYNKGLINKEEYQAKKSEILKNI